MKKCMNEILQEANDAPDFKTRLEILSNYDHPALRTVLKYVYDPSLKFLLGSDPIEFNKNQIGEAIPSILYHEARKLYLFVEGGNDNLTPKRRMQLFIQLLENVDPGEAELLLHVRNKKLPYSNIDKRTIKKAFPNLL